MGGRRVGPSLTHSGASGGMSFGEGEGGPSSWLRFRRALQVGTRPWQVWQQDDRVHLPGQDYQLVPRKEKRVPLLSPFVSI